jgi:hypothetical protein
MREGPNPEEARQALAGIENSHQQTLQAAEWPRAWWIGGGVVLAAFGVVTDLAPGFFREWGGTVSTCLLLLVVLSSTRWGRSLTGNRVRPRLGGTTKRWIGGAVFGILAALAAFLVGRWSVPHLGLIIGVAGGLLLAVAGPWWQSRVLHQHASHT